MKNFYVDPVTYDLSLKNNNLRITETPQEHLSAKIESNLKTFAGEHFADYTLGVPYFDDVLKKQVDISNVTSLFSDYIRSIEGVEELIDFSTTYDGLNRLYTYTFEVRASSGELVQGGGTV